MKLILKKTSSDPITFEDIINERIKLMQNSAKEYDKFLKLLDDLITIIDLTMDSMRLTVIKKTVCFTEHNEVFLIPPRESSPWNSLTNPFPDLFHWKMPPIRASRPYLTAFSSDELFRFSSTTTDIRHVYLLLAGNRHLHDNFATFILPDKWPYDKKKTEQRQQHEINELNLLHEFAEATFEEACFGGLDNIFQPVIHMRRERNHCPCQRTYFPPSVLGQLRTT